MTKMTCYCAEGFGTRYEHHPLCPLVSGKLLTPEQEKAHKMGFKILLYPKPIMFVAKFFVSRKLRPYLDMGYERARSNVPIKR